MKTCYSTDGVTTACGTYTIGKSYTGDPKKVTCQRCKAAQPSAQRICCTDCETEVSEDDAYCPKCGLVNPANR